MKRSFTRVGLIVACFGVPATAGAQSENLTVHGYLTQAYARLSGDVPLYGLTEDGTTDYRSLALQFRYAIDENQALVTQFSHRRLAKAAIQELEPSVDLDWAFFQTDWKGNNIRVGKVPMPRGLYNEVRDVGVIFPFFRASKGFYSEGVETVDGASISRNITIGGGFDVDAFGYGGGYDIRLELVDQDGPYLAQSRISKAGGLHLNLSTPIPGLRLSGDYLYGEYQDSENSLSIATLSADMTRDRWFVRGEYLKAQQRNEDRDPTFAYTSYYAQAGLAVLPKFWVNAQYEYNGLDLQSLPFEFTYDNIKDLAVGVAYKISPLLVLKGEYHDFEGYQLDVASFPPLNPATGQALPPAQTSYWIVSLSAAF